MGRPSKKYVDYFPHDTDASDRRTIFILESKHGNNGYAFWFKLLETLGRKEGHFLDLNSESEALFLSAKTRVSTVEMTDMLNLLAELGAIDAELWDKKVVWSSNFVDRISDAYRLRKEFLPKKPTLSGISTVEMPVSTVESTESKGKGKEIIGKEIKDNEYVREKFPDLFTVLISETEYLSLVQKFGEIKAKEKIEELHFYVGSKGKKYKSHYLTILNWERKNGKTELGTGKNKIGAASTNHSQYAGIGKSIDDI